MKVPTTGNRLKGRGTGRLAGALGLLLALALLAGGVVPAYATDELEPPPLLPHFFGGTIRVIKPAGPVPEGTVVEAFLDGVKKAETTADAAGGYQLVVAGERGDEGKTVSFKVAGVDANETAVWASGALDTTFDLTIAALPGQSSSPFPFPLPCFIATAAYGSPTAGQLDVLREFRDVVLLESTLGSRFVTWYYRTSPPVAEFIAGNEVVRILVRELVVDPVVWVVQATGTIWQMA